MIKVKYLEPKILDPYDNNSRVHSAEQIDRIKRSIKEFGFINPVLIDKHNTIVAGHARVEAAIDLGLIEIPTIELADLTEEQIRAYVIADNRLAELSSWDDEMLRIEIEGLQDLNFDISVVGFSQEDLDELLFDDEAVIDLPDLPDGDKEPFQQMTFTMHDDQAEVVRLALDKAKEEGCDSDLNDNSNGNAIYHVCMRYLYG